MKNDTVGTNSALSSQRGSVTDIQELSLMPMTPIIKPNKSKYDLVKHLPPDQNVIDLLTEIKRERQEEE